MVYYTSQGKVAGELRDGVYRKLVDSKKHKMKIYDAYAIDEEIVTKLDGQCKEIRLKEKDTNEIYFVDFDLFKEKGFVKAHDTKQRFLPMKYWTREGDMFQQTLI